MTLLIRSDKSINPAMKTLFIILLMVLLSSCSLLPGDNNATPESVSQQSRDENGSGDVEEVKPESFQASQSDSSQVYSAADWSSEAKKTFGNAARYLKKNPDRAVKGFYEAIKLAPSMEPAYFNVAKIAYEKNNSKMLNKIMQKAQQNNIGSPRLFTAFALGMRQQSKFNDAKKLYSRAIKLNNSYLPAILNMAILEDVYMGHLKKAESFYLSYQQQLQVQGKEDKRLKNWLTDLKQRLKKQQKGAGK